jgi:AraC-like DNA-binding protein
VNNSVAQQNDANKTVLQTKLDSLRQIEPPLKGLEKLYAYFPLMGYLVEMEKEEMTAFFNEYESVIEEELKNEKNSELKQQYHTHFAQMKYNHCIYMFNSGDFEELEKTLHQLMDFCYSHEIWRHFYRSFNLLIESYVITKKYELAKIEINKLYDKAKKRNHINGMMEASYSLGRVYHKQYRYEDAEKYALECIELSKTAIFKEVCYQVFEAHLLYILTLHKQEKIAQILPALQQYELVISDLEKLEAENDAVNPLHQMYLNNLFAQYYILIKDYEKADSYRKKLSEALEKNINSDTGVPSDYYLIYAQILEGKGNIEEAMLMFQQVRQAMIEDATGNDEILIEILLLEARLNIRTGKAEEGIALYDSIFKNFLKIRNTEFNAQIDELRTIYETDKVIAEKERNRLYFYFALVGCLLLAIALGIWIRHSRTIAKRNRGLYRQIKEQDRLAEELAAVTKQYNEIMQTVHPQPVQSDQSALFGTHIQRQLVSRFNDYLLLNNKYLEYDLDIKDLIPELTTNRTTLFEALKAVTNKTPMDYIYHLRLDDAKRLLESSNLTIEHIAYESGFRTARTLYKMFRERFKISPADYRKIAKETENES